MTGADQTDVEALAKIIHDLCYRGGRQVAPGTSHALAQHILASDWLAARDGRVAAERDAAVGEAARHYITAHEWRQRATDTEAERDRLAAKVARVEALVAVAEDELHPEVREKRLNEGDYALLRVRVARANSEQAFVTFDSMEGQYSIRVPLSELQPNPNTENWSIPI